MIRIYLASSATLFGWLPLATMFTSRSSATVVSLDVHVFIVGSKEASRFPIALICSFSNYLTFAPASFLSGQHLFLGNCATDRRQICAASV
jgi:hypothetical protein